MTATDMTVTIDTIETTMTDINTRIVTVIESTIFGRQYYVVAAGCITDAIGIGDKTGTIEIGNIAETVG